MSSIRFFIRRFATMLLGLHAVMPHKWTAIKARDAFVKFTETAPLYLKA
jgi:hypothetical protein